MKYLVIEDDVQTAQIVASALSEPSHSVEVCHNGLEGFEKAQTGRYDVIVADVMLPEMSGLKIAENLRSSGNKTPLLLLSGLSTENDRIQGLTVGSDDYLTKPFNIVELKLRVRNLSRHSVVDTKNALVLNFKDLRLDRLSRTALRQDKKIDLQEKEYLLLELFMSHPNEVIGKSTILKKIWNYEFDPDTNIVDVLVCRLRNKIEKGFTNRMLYTVRGVGYILK